MFRLLRPSLLVPLLLLTCRAAPATGGLHAIYGGSGLSHSIDIRIADNGDFEADTGHGRRVVRKGGETFLVQQRFTGPLVTRAADLRALAAERAVRAGARARALPSPGLVPRGERVVNGRRGEAFAFPGAAGDRGETEAIVVSRDPALAPLGAAIREVWFTESLPFMLGMEPPEPPDTQEDELASLFGNGTPLRYDRQVLLAVETTPIEAGDIVLPAEPETREALRARLAEDRQDPGPTWNISRAAFAEGRLWLLTDDGKLSSMADGGGPLRPEEAGGKVVGLCNGARGLVAATGGEGSGQAWTIRVRRAGRWETAAAVPPLGDKFVALSCEGPEEVVLTSRRLIALAGDTPRSTPLAGELSPGLVNAATHVTPDFVYLGIDAGEWGGGLQRIDRRTGMIAAIERKEGEGPCQRPLDSACDPVNAVATPPWAPQCVVAALGLVHMAASGRLVLVCGTRVTLLYARPVDPHLGEARFAKEAAEGGLGAVPFYGLAVRGDTLLALGADGIYRVGRDRKVVRQDFPRFREAGGVLVSFDLPEAVLVLTQINRRASVSGSAPMLVPR